MCRLKPPPLWRLARRTTPSCSSAPLPSWRFTPCLTHQHGVAAEGNDAVNDSSVHEAAGVGVDPHFVVVQRAAASPPRPRRVIHVALAEVAAKGAGGEKQAQRAMGGRAARGSERARARWLLSKRRRALLPLTQVLTGHKVSKC